MTILKDPPSKTEVLKTLQLLNKMGQQEDLMESHLKLSTPI